MRVELKPMGLSSYYAANKRFVAGQVYDVSDPDVLRAVVDNEWFNLDRSQAYSIIHGGEDISPEPVMVEDVIEDEEVVMPARSRNEVSFVSPVQSDAVETYYPDMSSSESDDADDVFVNEGVIVESAEVAAASARNEFDKYDCPEEGCEKVGEKGFVRHGSVAAHVNKVHLASEEPVLETFPGVE